MCMPTHSPGMYASNIYTSCVCQTHSPGMYASNIYTIMCMPTHSPGMYASNVCLLTSKLPHQSWYKIEV